MLFVEMILIFALAASGIAFVCLAIVAGAGAESATPAVQRAKPAGVAAVRIESIRSDRFDRSGGQPDMTSGTGDNRQSNSPRLPKAA